MISLFVEDIRFCMWRLLPPVVPDLVESKLAESPQLRLILVLRSYLFCCHIPFATYQILTTR